jgi:F-type H+-transporting ATPase subunit b
VPSNAAPHSTGFPPFDATTFPSQILWLAITFGVLYAFVSRVVVPRVGGIIEERSDRIARDLDEAARLNARAEEAMASYEKALGDARAKAQAIAQEARDAVTSQSDARRKVLEADLATRLAAAEKTIADRKVAAMGSVREIAADTVGVLVERLVGSAPKPGEIDAALDAANR